MDHRKDSPVDAFRSAKTVSIEQALIPIVPQIYQLPYYITRALKQCCYPSKHGLTCDESAAIYIYTMEWGNTALYRILNEALRSESQDVLTIWFPCLKLFHNALQKLPTTRQVLWRGVTNDIGMTLAKDEIVTWWSISSCSSSINVIKSFIGTSKNSTLYMIYAKNGKKLAGFTEFENEEEIILPIGSKFRVKTDPLKQSNGSFLVHLVELDYYEDNDHGKVVGNESFVLTKSTIPTTVTTPHGISSFMPLRGTSVDIKASTKWSQHGETVAGGHGPGEDLNQLYHPRGVYVHDDFMIYVADGDNHRIMAWSPDDIGKNGKVVAGGRGYGSDLNQLHYPSDVIVDRFTDTLVICDWRNRRVVRWPRYNGKQGKIVVGNIDCFGVTMNDRGYLYVTDYERHEVRCFQFETDTQGIVVAGRKGRGDRKNQLNWPAHLFIDRNHSLYVSEDYNHRVTKWVDGSKEGIIVAGGYGIGDAKSQLRSVKGILVDDMDTVYMADWENHRVMRWPQENTLEAVWFGGNSKGARSKDFDGCGGLSFDRYGNIYVVDFRNHRIQRFSIV